MPGERIPVRFHFYPAEHISKSILPNDKKAGWTVLRKDETDRIRRYLCGISSGMDIDAHGDRMAEECIKSFIAQFGENKPIALYVNHGQNYTKDIGLLVKAELTAQKEFYTEYRIYDEYDIAEGVPKDNVEEATHAWNQSNGIGVYKGRPRQFGFSIEGFIDESNVRQLPSGGREILDVDLDPGVSLVTKPAYINSRAVPIANGISKSLDRHYRKGLLSPEEKEPSTLDDRTEPNTSDTGREMPVSQITQSRLDMALDSGDREAEYLIKVHELKETFEDVVDNVRNDRGLNPDQKQEELIKIFDSFKSRMLALYSEYGDLATEEAEPQPTVITAIEDDGPPSATMASDEQDKPMTKAQKAHLSKIASVVKGLHDNAVRKDATLNEDFKTVLADVVAALQMLMQSDAGDPGVAQRPEEDEGMMNAQKSQAVKAAFAQLLKESEQYLKEPGEDTEKAEHKEPDGDEGVMKDTVASPGTSGDTADAGAEDLFDDLPEVQPEEVHKMIAMLRTMKKRKEMQKSNTELVSLRKQVANLTSAMENLVYGLGIDEKALQSAAPQPIQKGVAGNIGQDQLVAVLSDLITKGVGQKFSQPSEPTWGGRDDSLDIRKNSGAIAEDFARHFNIGR